MTQHGSARLFALAVSAAVATAVIVGLFVVGSPGDARIQKLDRRRVSDLYEIVDSVNAYWRRKESLPPDFQALSDEVHFVPHSDPETGQLYDYRALDNGTYELCATFALECESAEDSCSHWRAKPGAEIGGHGSGRQCFEITPEPVEGQR
ncbi:MAG: hypothetical protein WBM48_01665 [Polyangiales bacterium]|jgi:hypothetical protein